VRCYGCLGYYLERRYCNPVSDYLSELRTVKGKITGSVDERCCKVLLFEREKKAYGSYMDEAAVNEGFIEIMKATTQDVFTEMVAAVIRAMPEHDILLTHSDIAP